MKTGILFAIFLLLVGSSCIPQKQQKRQTKKPGSMIFDDRIERPNRAEYILKYSCGSDKFEFSFVTTYKVADVRSNELLKIRINGRRPVNHSELEELYTVFKTLKEPDLPLYPICEKSGSRLGFRSTAEGDAEVRGFILVVYLFNSGRVEYAFSDE